MTLPPDMQVEQFWPTTFYRRAWAGQAADAASVTEFLYGLRAGATVSIASGVAPAAKSAHGLFEGDFDLFTLGHAGFAGWSRSCTSRSAFNAQVRPIDRKEG